MTSIAAGVSCSGPGAHLLRYWQVGPERQLSWRDPGSSAETRKSVRDALTLPIPGSAAVVAVDAWNARVLLADGAAWRLELFDWRPRWLPLTKECELVKATSNGSPPTYVSGGTGCQCVWVVDAKRRVWVWTPSGRQQVGGESLPGTETILAADPSRATVILDTGEALAWLNGRWVLTPAFGSSFGTMQVKCVGVAGICTSAGDVNPGDSIELPEAEARSLIRMGRVEPQVP